MFETRKEMVALAAAGIAVGATALALWWNPREKRTRRAKLQCSCGEVEAQIYMPSANYKYLDTACFQCSCTDCVGWADAVVEAGASKTKLLEICTPGFPCLSLYDSEILVTKGQNLLKSMKLSAKSENRRIHSTCCNTPLAISVDHTSLNLVNYLFVQTKTNAYDLHEIGFPPDVLIPAVCLHGKTAQANRKINPESMKVVPYVDAKYILGIISRVLLLLLLGTRGPGAGFPTTGDIDIGIESIQSG
jgi:Family of unknown function (DUF6151)